MNRMTAGSRQRLNDSTIQRSNLSIANRQRTCALNFPLLRRLTMALLGDLLRIQRYDLGIYLVATAEITRLNETFLGHAGPTDVITFDYMTPPLASPSPIRWERGGVRALHGDIIVCVDEAVAQARRFRTSWQSEIVRYLIHGLLHLLGYNDRTVAARRRMRLEEDYLMREMAAHFPVNKLGRKRITPR